MSGEDRHVIDNAKSVRQLRRMPLHKLPEIELRDHAKRAIEALELWLRRLIDGELVPKYGAGYLSATKPDGGNLISRKITKDMIERRTANPSRYPRSIDAALLDDAIKIVCKPELYDHFREALKEAFPLGSEHVRITLDRLVITRNALYHSNPISVRQAEQAICYSNDTLASLKAYYERKNMGDQFNAPTIIRISDSLGNVFHSSQLTELGGGSGRAALRNNQHSLATLHAGETLSLEIEVDPSFDKAGYSIHWHVPNDRMVQNNSERLTLQLEAKHVAKIFQLQAMIVSKKPYHRYGTHDDSVAIAYCVLPPQ